MTIGEVIRKYRKEAGLTQEEMANRLGVTTPAVNKWEKNNTQPDIGLLAPIARLLGVSTDTLLSFHDALTDDEINLYVRDLDGALDEKPYDEVFASAKKKLEEYPNCKKLFWQTAIMLDARRLVSGMPEADVYEDAINSWYSHCLDAEDETIRNAAAESLFNTCLRKEQYEKAEEYLSYLSNENPGRRRLQALVYSKTGNTQEAYRSCSLPDTGSSS